MIVVVLIEIDKKGLDRIMLTCGSSLTKLSPYYRHYCHDVQSGLVLLQNL
jgi:hypothetical protein